MTIAAGSVLRMSAKVGIGVGYYERATLAMRGTPEAPISIEPQGGRWAGIELRGEAAGSRIEHVNMRGTSGPGIRFEGASDGLVSGVDCADCVGPTVRWACESTVSNDRVSATGSTPAPLAPPSGCG